MRRPRFDSFVLPRAFLLVTCLPMAGVPAAEASPPKYVEEFNTTTYKDAGNTTLDWNTSAGKLQLFPFQRSLEGVADTPGTATGVAALGNQVLVSDGLSGFHMALIDVYGNNPPGISSTVDTPGNALGIAVFGSYVLVADDAAGLQVYSLEGGFVANYNTPGNASGVTTSGNLALVADGTSGLQMISLTAAYAPTFVGTYNTPGSALGVAVSGTRAYVADGISGLQIIDITNPALPSLLGTYDTPGTAKAVAVSGNIAFVADDATGLKIVDVTNPALPTLLATYDTPGNASGVAVHDKFAYVADGGFGLQVIDVSNPASPALVWSYDTGGYSRGVAFVSSTPTAMVAVADDNAGITVTTEGTWRPILTSTLPTAQSARDVVTSGSRAYVADYVSGLHVYDIANPAAPVRLGGYDTPGNALRLAVAGNTAYLADGPTLQIVNVTNPASPSLLGSYPLAGGANSVAVSGTRAYVASGVSGVVILNVSNPASPSLLGSYDTPGYASDIAVVGDTVYVADGGSGLLLLRVTNPAAPFLMGTLDTPGSAMGVAVLGTRAFVADGIGGVRVINVFRPGTSGSPAEISSGYGPYPATDISISGTIAYVMHTGYSGFSVFDVSSVSPISLATYTPSYFYATSAAGLGAFALVAAEGGLHSFEILQRRFETEKNLGSSTAIVSGPDSIVRVRITANQVGTVRWSLPAANNVTPGTWAMYAIPYPVLAWTCYLDAPDQTVPEVSRLELEYEYANGFIRSVQDVANDQGGRVRLQFDRSGYDFGDETLPVVGYQIYHRIDEGALALRVRQTGVIAASNTLSPLTRRGIPSAAVRSLDDRQFVLGGQGGATAFPAGTWEAVAWVAATQSPTYLVPVSTNGDSTPGGTSWSTYLVTTHSTNPARWWISQPDSGYSVDNLAPGVPTGFASSRANAANDLEWNPSPEVDFQYFRVYRGTQLNFTPGPGNLVHTTSVTSWTDASPVGPVYYKLTAVDHAGNESAPASANATVAVEAAALPARFALHTPSPNPFRSAITLHFDVPAGGGRVALRIYDVAGRLVRSLVEGRPEPGARDVTWDGRDESGNAVASGLYFCRMQAPAFSRSLKLMRQE